MHERGGEANGATGALGDEFGGVVTGYPLPVIMPPGARAGASLPYTLRATSWLLVTFVVTMVLFDSEGLVTWARRLPVGPAQDAWVTFFRNVHDLADAGGLTVPRKLLARGADRAARALGAGEDPLLSTGWTGAAETVEQDAFVRGGDGRERPRDLAEAGADPGGSPASSGKQQATVLLLGDSMMAGALGAAISKSLEEQGQVRVVEASQSATGLSRPEVFDWMRVVPPLLKRERPRFVICSLGANDAQRIHVGGQVHEFEEPGWRTAYRGRVREIMRALAGERTRVLWLGLPPMRDLRYAQRVEALNRIFSDVAGEVPGVEYFELGMVLGGQGAEGYSTFGSDEEGRLVRMRLEDGVHYSAAGARAIATWVAEWVREGTRRKPSVPGAR